MKSKVKQLKVDSVLTKHPAFVTYMQRIPSAEERYKLRVSTPKDLWRPSGYVAASLVKKLEEHKWTPEERESVTRGLVECPVCNDRGTYLEVFEADIKLNNEEPLTIVHERDRTCKCQMWKHIWSEAKKEIPSMYHYVSLATLKPNTLSRLTAEQQQVELDHIRKYRNGSFLFFGPSGTGKTTFSMALLRHAYERKSNQRYFWDEDRKGLSYSEHRWIWRGNFNTLVQEHNEKNKQQWGETVDAPDVSVKKIYAAREAGRRPVLIIEEVDKIELNSHRVKFLFGLIDAMLNTNGQIILTTNLTQAAFVKVLSDADPVSGETIARRLIQAGSVRDYFEYVPAD